MTVFENLIVFSNAFKMKQSLQTETNSFIVKLTIPFIFFVTNSLHKTTFISVSFLTSSSDNLIELIKPRIFEIEATFSSCQNCCKSVITCSILFLNKTERIELDNET